ncbi:MAG: VOC family protein [Gammaproteobacteria bacterium]|nr:VOC family protein [Gammaproteobacteria bacterium]
MVRPKRIGHVVLNVRDLAESERFYTDVLGFRVSLKRDNGTFLTCGKIHHDLALFQAPEDAAPAGDLGLNHIAVQIENLDELKEVHRRLKSCGARIDHLTDHGMTKSVYFRDPDGNRIEYFFNTTETAEEGLAMMKASDRVLTEFALEDA